MLILRCVTSMAMLACVGVNEEGFTEVLAVEVQFRAGSWCMEGVSLRGS
jgi:hypothetical protein